MLTVLTALAVVAVGCSGGGSSSSSGGSSVQMSKVQGNVRSASVAWIDSAGGTRTASSELLLSVLNRAVSPAQAQTTLEGIEVCIAGTCTTTDVDGFFTLDISGIDTGLYALTFQVGGVIYTMPLSEEISSTSIVIVTDVSILDSGEVTAGEISYQHAGSLDGSIEGGVTSAPEDEDTDSGDGQPKVVICHKPDTPAEHTLTVAEPAVPAHLDHGDYLGACIDDDDDVNDDDEVIDEGGDSPVDD